MWWWWWKRKWKHAWIVSLKIFIFIFYNCFFSVQGHPHVRDPVYHFARVTWTLMPTTMFQSNNNNNKITHNLLIFVLTKRDRADLVLGEARVLPFSVPPVSDRCHLDSDCSRDSSGGVGWLWCDRVVDVNCCHYYIRHTTQRCGKYNMMHHPSFSLSTFLFVFNIK